MYLAQCIWALFTGGSLKKKHNRFKSTLIIEHDILLKKHAAEMCQVDSFYGSLERLSKSLAVSYGDFIDWNVAFWFRFSILMSFCSERCCNSGIELCYLLD